VLLVFLQLRIMRLRSYGDESRFVMGKRDRDGETGLLSSRLIVQTTRDYVGADQ
jgi:hypothetical protein